MRTHGSQAHLLTRLAMLVALVAGMFVMTATPALAHSKVDETYPADGGTVAQSPLDISIGFNEVVTMTPDSMTLIDASGKATQLPAPVVTPDNVGSAAVSEPIPTLADGWYAVRWSAVSSDGHPVQGAFTFYVGDPNQAATAQEVDADDLSDPAEPYLLVLPYLRGLGYLAALIAVGSVIGVWALSDRRSPMPDPAISRARRVAAVSAVTGLFIAPVTLVVSAILLNGGSTSALGSTVQLVLQSSSGASLMVRASALFAVCTAVLLLMERSTRIVGYVVGALAAAGIAVSYTMAGHPALVDGKTVASIGGVMHIAAASLWLGGIPALIAALSARSKPTIEQAAAAVDRFSKIATVSVLLVITGGLMTATQMFSDPSELVTTQYGLALIGKVALVGLIALVGAYNHFMLVPAMRRSAAEGGGTPATTVTAFKHLRTSLLAEGVALLLILAATAFMTNTGAPAASGSHGDHLGISHSHGAGGSLDVDLQLALADLEPRIVAAPLGDGEVEISYLPGRSDRENRMSVRVFDSSGAQVTPEQLSLTFSNEVAGIEGVERDATVEADGTATLNTRDLGIPGEWTARVDLELTDGTVDYVDLPISIAAPRTSEPAGAP